MKRDAFLHCCVCIRVVGVRGGRGGEFKIIEMHPLRREFPFSPSLPETRALSNHRYVRAHTQLYYDVTRAPFRGVVPPHLWVHRNSRSRRPLCAAVGPCAFYLLHSHVSVAPRSRFYSADAEKATPDARVCHPRIVSYVVMCVVLARANSSSVNLAASIKEEVLKSTAAGNCKYCRARALARRSR